VQIDVKEWRDEEPGVLNVTALQVRRVSGRDHAWA
jgi:hypothetical protein